MLLDPEDIRELRLALAVGYLLQSPPSLLLAVGELLQGLLHSSWHIAASIALDRIVSVICILLWIGFKVNMSIVWNKLRHVMNIVSFVVIHVCEV
jgi:hypothetical protein